MFEALVNLIIETRHLYNDDPESSINDEEESNMEEEKIDHISSD